MRSAIVLIPSNRNVQKAPVIHRAALRYILLSLAILLTVGTPLKNYR